MRNFVEMKRYAVLRLEGDLPEFHLPYGKKIISFTIPAPWPVDLIAPAQIDAAPNPSEVVRQALQNPVGGKRIADFKSAQSVAIAINDKTRPVPHRHLLPPLLEHLETLFLPLKAPFDAITFLIATGTHPPLSPDEFSHVLPQDILSRYPVVCHNAYEARNLVHLGQTSRGTPIWINRHFIEADLRIVVGNIEPHQFMGFSGGVKSAVIGLGGAETVNHNHALMRDPQAKLGQFEGNPARQDVEEMGRLVGVDFALNAVLNGSKEIVEVIAGEPEMLMQTGIPLVRQTYQVPVFAPFDVLIVSPGGHPKDINVYQAQKALAQAALVTKKGGTIILCAACPEGSGSEKYEAWVSGLTSPETVIQKFQQEGFRIGPHKAFQIAKDAVQVRLLLYSDLRPDLAKRLLFNPVEDLAETIDLTLQNLPPTARIGVMPWANATIPI